MRRRSRFLITVLLAAVLLGALPVAAASAEHILVTTFEDPFTEDDEGLEVWDPWAGYIDTRTDADRTSATRGFVQDGVRVRIPAFTNRGTGGLAVFDPAPEEAWFRYYLRLDAWQAANSGKLPGLAGLYGSSARGCVPSAEDNPGWSARTMFVGTGTEGADPGGVRLGTYLYHLDQEGDCGDGLLWQPGILDQDRWYCIEGHIRMNTPGIADGRVDAWVDGTPALAWPDVAFRRAGEDLGVRHFWANIYFGGTDVNPSDLVSSIDNIVVSDSGRVGCLDPFADDDTSPHEEDINELYARGVLFGCSDQEFCPKQQLTRAEMAALLQRALGLEEGPDRFADDDGHWAEGPINAVAQAGITRGCSSTSFCPDRTLTRAEMAVFLDRAFDLAEGEDVFSDDDGHWAEVSINALAASGITRGCGDDRFCPEGNLLREHAATFIRRAMGYPLPPDTVGFAGDRLGELAPDLVLEDDEPAPDLDGHGD
jgi:hypothetical protein